MKIFSRFVPRALVVGLLLACGIAQAAPGDLDPTFGRNGVVVTDFPTQTPNELNDINPLGAIRDAAGRVLVLGGNYLSRYLPDGNLDTSFNYQGKRDLGYYRPADAALQSDGKIVVVAQNYRVGTQEIFRLNEDGTLDASFGNQGYVVPGFSGIAHIALSSTGKIACASVFYDSSAAKEKLEVACLNSDGSFNSTFGEGGKVFIPNAAYSRPSGLAISPNDKILVSESNQILRLNTNGTLDTNFGTNGFKTLSHGVSALKIFDSEIYAGGVIYNGASNVSNTALSRVHLDGTTDTGFGSTGTGVLNHISQNGYDVPLTMSFSSTGQILLGGYTTFDTNSEFPHDDGLLARFTSAGVADTSFDGDGAVNFAIGTYGTYVKNILADTDGSVTSVVFSQLQSGVQTNLTHNLANGALDSAFGMSGVLALSTGDGIDYGLCMALTGDNKIVVAGFSTADLPFSYYNAGALAFARYNTDGSLDTSFSEDGLLVIDLGAAQKIVGRINAVTVQGDGKIVAVGTRTDLTRRSDGFEFQDIVAVRLNTDGSLDNSFGMNGIFIHDFDTYRGDDGCAVTLQSDGKILIGGAGAIVIDDNNITSCYTLLRLNPNGTLDDSFDGDGYVLVPGVSGSSSNTFTTVAIGPNNTIYAAGTNYRATAPVLMRFKNDGSLDASFDGDGQLALGIAGALPYFPAIAVQTDGKIVCFGSNGNASYSTEQVARYNSDATLDTNFGTNGKANIDGDFNGSIALQSDGKIVLGGGLRDVTRLRSDGSLDLGFGQYGYVHNTLNTGGTQLLDRAGGLAIQKDGKIVMAETTFTALSHDFCVVRLLGGNRPGYDVSGKCFHYAPDAAFSASTKTNLPGATVTLQDSAGQTVLTTTTDSTGLYKFAKVPTGSYKVSAQLVRSGQATVTLDPATRTFDITNSAVAVPKLSLYTIFGVVKATNSSGVTTPKTGAIVSLKDVTGTVLATRTTASDGRFSFTKLAAGTYKLSTTLLGFTFANQIGLILPSTGNVASPALKQNITGTKNAPRSSGGDS